MTYRQIRFLRHQLGLSVQDLCRKFPQHRRKIHIAEWSFRPLETLARLSRRDRKLYDEVIACRDSLRDDE